MGSAEAAMQYKSRFFCHDDEMHDDMTHITSHQRWDSCHDQIWFVLASDFISITFMSYMRLGSRVRVQGTVPVDYERTVTK